MSQDVEPLPPESPDRTREELRVIAGYQKGLCVCILVYLLGMVGFMTMHALIAPFAYLFLPIPLLMAAFVLLMAIKLYDKGVGIVLGILTIIPRIGLIVMLIVNGKATRTLKEYGLTVGLFGADMKQLDS